MTRGPGGRSRSEWLLSSLSPVVLILLWEIAARVGWVDIRFFPAPSAVLRELAKMLADGELWQHLSVTVERVLIGFALGAVPGVILGILMGLSGTVRAVLMPLVHATFPIPKVAILPLFILMLGLGEASKYAVIAVSVVYIVLINAYEGVRGLNPLYFDVGRNFRVGRWTMFSAVALPGALPNILAGLKTGLGVALLVIVAAEFVGARAGIGYLIWNSWQIFAVEKMYVGLMLTALLGFASAAAFNLAERLLLPWRPRPG